MSAMNCAPPLNMIIGFSEMILYSPGTYGGNLPSTLLSDMRVIHSNSKHLSQLINDVLQLSQIEAGQMSLSRTWVNMADLVTEAVDATQPLYRTKGLTLDVNLPSAEHDSGEDGAKDGLLVFCDRLRIRQILLNLLSNAGRYTQQGGVCIKVVPNGDLITVSVSDTGPGIPAQDRERIFEPFQHGNIQNNRPHEGSGLGLSISKQLVEAHGGRMWLESQVGVGSTFFFTLPRIPDDTPRAARWINVYAAREVRPHTPLPTLPQPKERILLLSQEEELRSQIEAMVDTLDVKIVETLEEVEAEFANTIPSALLINEARVMHDPGLVRRSLANLPPRLPVVSCYLPGRQEACDYLNVMEYLVKPITAEQLLQVVERHAPPKGTILVVEDNRDMARLIRRQLVASRKGYRVLHAVSGQQAIEFMRERRPDLVLLDLGLPDQDGYQVLEQRNRDEEIRSMPVVIVSATDPLGEPVVADRLRVELAGGLSLRDVVQCTIAIGQALSPLRQSNPPTPGENSSDPPASE